MDISENPRPRRRLLERTADSVDVPRLINSNETLSYGRRETAGAALPFRAPTLTIVHTVSSLEVGGMEHLVLRLATAQREAGHRITILAMRGGPLQNEANDRGLVTCVLGSSRGIRIREALRHFLKVRPNVVHVHNPTSLQYAVLAKLVSRAPIVVTCHGDREAQTRLGTVFEWWLASQAVAVSHAAARSLDLPRSAGTPIVIHNGIQAVESDHARRTTTRELLGVSQALVGIIVARVDGRKGHDTLLQCLALLAAGEHRLKMLVLGDGKERSALEARAGELGLASTVHFLGSRSDVDRFLEAADFFVLPSDIEGLPLSVLEAMAHGLPIIASRVGGLPEMIDDGVHGLLVQPRDPVALAAAIGKIAEDPALRARLGSAAKARTKTDFSMDAVVRNYGDLYLRAINGINLKASGGILPASTHH